MEKEYQIKILSWISVLAITVLTPFFGYHVYNESWAIAILLLFIIISELLFINQGRKGHVSLLLQHAVAAFHTIGAVLVIYVLGGLGSYWIFPVVLSNFYLLSIRSALIINFIACILATLVIWDQPEIAFRLFASLTIMNTLGFVFSHLVSKQQRELLELSLIDPLTHTGNRRALDDKLAKIAKLNTRHGLDVSLIMIDIDSFKDINDKFDHNVGDLVLIEITKLIRRRLRQTDSLFRYGGEEFVIITLDTKGDVAELIAEELRQAVKDLETGPVRDLSISAGVAELCHEEAPETCLQRAAYALYSAKQYGSRDQVCTSTTQIAVPESC